MVEKKRFGAQVALAAALVLATGASHAALTVLPDPRFVYDNVLDVTWLRDANYAQTSGYDADGRMTWTQANTWADSLSFTLGSATYSEWRLPTATEVAPASIDYNSAGTGDGGYNITRSSSELSYMYYVNLANVGYCSTANFCPQSGYSSTPNATFSDAGTSGSASFQNLQSYLYWSGTAYSPNPSDDAWAFNTYYGGQSPYLQDYPFHAWAVHSGRVMAPVPEPHEWMMMAAGLGLVGWVARGRRRFGASGASAP